MEPAIGEDCAKLILSIYKKDPGRIKSYRGLFQ